MACIEELLLISLSVLFVSVSKLQSSMKNSARRKKRTSFKRRASKKGLDVSQTEEGKKQTVPVVFFKLRSMCCCDDKNTASCQSICISPVSSLRSPSGVRSC